MFGGDEGDYADAIVQYDLASGAASIVGHLTSGQDELGVAYLRGSFYVFGGSDPGSDEIQKWTPPTPCDKPLPEVHAPPPPPADVKANEAPVMDAVPEAVVVAGGTAVLHPTAHDKEHDPLAWSATVPAGATFDASSHVAKWTPDSHDFGRHCLFQFTATEYVLNGTGVDPDTQGAIPQTASATGCVRVVKDANQDSDGDGVADVSDNCPGAANYAQTDTDANGIGDACDAQCPDAHCNAMQEAPRTTTRAPQASGDACSTAGHPERPDLDGDGVTDACDNDMDGDGMPDKVPPGALVDNCPRVSNPDQKDSRGDGIGDACRAPQTTAPRPSTSPPSATTHRAAPSASLVFVTSLVAAVTLRRRHA